MINSLTITQLVENTTGGPGLLAEHGVAFFIEADGHCLLFDTGQGQVLSHNAKRLNLPVNQVESIILSHGHYDHAGGLVAALEMTGPVDLYLHPAALTSKFNRNGRDIGAPVSDLTEIRSLTRNIIDTQGPTEIAPGIHVTGEIPRVHTIEDTGGPFYTDQKSSQPDLLPDDQALYIETPNGLVLLLGCGHSGVINTLEYIQKLSDGHPLLAVIGGMHLLRASSERLSFTGDALMRLAITYLSPNHCTGLDAVCYLRNRFSDEFHESKLGTRHQFKVEA